MQNPDHIEHILKHLESIDTRLAKVDQIDARLGRVEEAIGPVERLTKIAQLAYWRGASATLREFRAGLTDIIGGNRAAHQAADPPGKGGEPPTASNASLGQTRRGIRVAGVAAVAVLLGASLTYAAWEPERDTRSSELVLPPSPQPAPPILPPPVPGPSPAPSRGTGTTLPAAVPVPGLLEQRPGLLPSPTGTGPATQDPPALLFEPSPTPAATGDCSGLGVQVRRIQVCRQRR